MDWGVYSSRVEHIQEGKTLNFFFGRRHAALLAHEIFKKLPEGIVGHGHAGITPWVGTGAGTASRMRTTLAANREHSGKHRAVGFDLSSSGNTRPSLLLSGPLYGIARRKSQAFDGTTASPDYAVTIIGRQGFVAFDRVTH